jgi:choline dehydrogenase-like flavoprotein
MILDGSSIPEGKTFDADICVVGSGAAGLTLALDLTRRGIKVVMIESGGLVFDGRSNQLLEVEMAGRTTETLVKTTRERFFGGTTNHWGGVCRAFDAFEFEPHPWMPYSGWPISRADLDPYYASAASLLGLPEVSRTFDAKALGVADRPRLVKEGEPDVEPIIWRRIPDEHLRMGQWRRQEVETSQLLTCVMNTSIVEIHPDASLKRIASLEGRAFGGHTLHFRARDFVLCTGAIENARLLLVSDSVVKGGLGNEHDLVGRFFMDHPANGISQVLLTDPAKGPTQEQFLAKSELLGWTTTPAARAKYHLQGFMSWVWPRTLAPQPQFPQELAMSKLTGLPTDKRDNDQPRYLEIVLNWEQAPNPDSRVMLSDKRDIFGVRKPLVHWDVLPQDLASAHKSMELISLAVARSGLGRVRWPDITNPLTTGGGHQMGTTRMANDPKQGVTNANCRVHSLENLFIGGSSLYPTGGWEHPTFTIVTLALRLADHLAARVKTP